MTIKIGNAPCSWGVEFADDPRNPSWTRVLDECKAAGYGGIELGPIGFMPEDPAALGDALRQRELELIGVHPVSSGYMLAFRYRILDADKAKVLNDRHTKAYLVDDATGIVLAVPALENIGELRPGSTPQPGRTYFMVFGNPGKVVKVGNLVTLVAGNFRADGIVVE